MYYGANLFCPLNNITRSRRTDVKTSPSVHENSLFNSCLIFRRIDIP